jgi:hypothetical protein
MFSEKVFGILVRNVAVFLTIIAVVLMVMLEQRKLYFEPSILVLQTRYDGQKDRIVKTKSNLSDFEVIFESENIQDFNATKNQLLVTTGFENQESALQLVNIQSKESQKVPLENKFVSDIIGAGDKFVLTIEDLNNMRKRSYIKKIGYINSSDNSIREFNPQFLATSIDDLFVNPSGSFLVFTGVGGIEYLAEIGDSQIVTKLNNDNLPVIGFVNDKQIAFTDYGKGLDPQVVIKDIITDSQEYIDLKDEKFGQLLVSSNAKTVHFTQSKNYKGAAMTGIKKLNNQYVFFIPDFSIEKLQLSSDDRYTLFNLSGYIPRCLQRLARSCEFVHN